MLIVAAQIRFSIRMRPDQNWRVACHRRTGRPQRPKHQGTPDQQAEEETDLPEPPKLDVRLSLVAEPEPAIIDIAHDAQPVAGQRAGDNGQRHPEQHVDEQSLAAGFPSPCNRRSEEQPGADPADADPNNRRLDVYVPQEVKWQDLVQDQPVKAAPIVVGMRHDRAGEDLQQQHGSDHQEIFTDLALAFGQWSEPR